jgi:anti-anti-sigma factor
MCDMAPSWELEVNRWLDWLFVAVRRPVQNAPEASSLAGRVWTLVEEQGAKRLVLELDEVDVLSAHLVGQLVVLRQRIASRGGVLRLSGLSPHNRKVLQVCGLEDDLPCYRTPKEAAQG